MKHILLFGAGKSATALIAYLGNLCSELNWGLTVCDADPSLAAAKCAPYPAARAVSFDITDAGRRQPLIEQADVVISMLPPALHFSVARDCLGFSKNLLTASYIDTHVQSLAAEIRAKGLLFIGEMGLDPGIDHMSAMRLIRRIRDQGGRISSFQSHCGGLMAPGSDDNPWRYKISWNPANVVTAGSLGGFYKKDGEIVEVLYSRVFDCEEQLVEVPSVGTLSWYPNRDSLSYIDTYQLHGIATFMRTTLRYPAFCRGWNKVVYLDLTDKNDHEAIKNCKTYADWFALKTEMMLDRNPEIDQRAFFDDQFRNQADFLGLTSTDPLPRPVPASAALLQGLLEDRLAMNTDDRDMVVMLHELEYSIGQERRATRSWLVVEGIDKTRTAMARTVGMPLGIAAKLILQNKIALTGLHVPVLPEIYEPVLAELEQEGIRFHEETRSLT